MTVLQNDTSTDPGSLLVQSFTQPSHGTVTQEGQSLRYTHTDQTYTGTDSFTYTASDSTGQASTATVQVSFTAAPAPTAAPDTITLTKGGAATGSVDVLANDSSFDGSPLTLVSVTNGTYGVATTRGNEVVYVASDPTNPQVDTLTYVARDRLGHESTGTVNVRVTSQSAPTTRPDTLTVQQDTPGTVDVVSNDVSFDKTPLTVTSVGDAPHGTTRVVDNKVVYTPDTGFAGQDTFTYVITDRVGKETTGTVTVTVTPKAPTAGPDTLTVQQDTSGTVDVVANDTSFDGSPLTLVSVSDAPHGTTLIVDGKVDYTPDTGFTGQDTFTYVVRDKTGTETTGIVTVTVTPKGTPPVTATPTANPDTLTVQQDTPGTVDVVANDTSFDGSPLTVTSVGDAPHGSTRIVDNKVVYTPNTGFTGQDTFTYVITDRVGKETTGTVTVTVTPKTAPPAGDTPQRGQSGPAPVNRTTPTHLAYTGAETSELLLVGFALLAGGVTMTVVTRRRKGTMPA